MTPEIIIFLKRLGRFILIPVIGFLISIPVLDLVNRSKLAGYKVKTDVETLLAGDSHISNALDASLVPHSVNIAQPAEPYYFTFVKLKSVLNSNPGIRKVVLGFSYHNLSTYLDSNLQGKKGEAITANYFFILPYRDQWTMFKSFSGNLGPYVKQVMKSGMKNALKAPGRQSFSGQFDNVFSTSKAVDSSMSKRIRYQYYPEGTLAGFSEQNIAWLDSIVRLCRSRNVSLALLNTPMHPAYRSAVPAAFQERYKTTLERYGLPVIDLSTIPMDDDHYTPDGDHLSQKGAKEFSTLFSQRTP